MRPSPSAETIHCLRPLFFPAGPEAAARSRGAPGPARQPQKRTESRRRAHLRRRRPAGSRIRARLPKTPADKRKWPRLPKTPADKRIRPLLPEKLQPQREQPDSRRTCLRFQRRSA